jgi:hypothetical protein
MLVMALGMGGVFVAVTTAANADVPANQAGLATGLRTSNTRAAAPLILAPSDVAPEPADLRPSR